MKKHIQILFTLLALFLLNGNGILYANTFQHSDFSLSENNGLNNSFENIESSFEKLSLIVVSKPHPAKSKSEEAELSNFVKKEEKIKPIYFKYITVQTVFTSFFKNASFNKFYYSRKPSLKNYFKSFLSYTYKRYLLLQVFRI